jgi:Domain of unknown function (DUF1707)
MVQPGEHVAAAAAAGGQLRASDADREQVIGMLEAAFAVGQLTKAEFDLGVNRTLASRTYADLVAATAGLQAPLRRTRPRPGSAAAWGVCGLIVTAFLTVVIVPSGTTKGVVAVTAVAVYASFCLLAGIMMLASRRGWLRLTRPPWPPRSGMARRRWPRPPAAAPRAARGTGLAGTRRT